MLKKLLPLILISALLVGCVTKPTGDTFCAVEKPKFVTSQELKSMSEKDLKEFIARNEFGERTCGWEAVRR